MFVGHEELEDMSLVEHGKFTLIAETLGWTSDQLATANDLLAINDQWTDAEGCEGA